jgi:hypothetical protein
MRFQDSPINFGIVGYAEFLVKDKMENAAIEVDKGGEEQP